MSNTRGPVDLDLIRRLEEISLNALPARQTVIDDGWVLRLTGGGTGRANAAYPLYPGSDDLGTRIDRVEAVYRAAGLAPMFKLTSASLPTVLDDTLERRGYTLRGSDTEVQTADLETSPCALWPTGVRVAVETAVSDAWLTTFGATHSNWSSADMDLKRWMLEAIATPAAYLLLSDDAGPIGVGTAIVDGEWVGLFDIALIERARGRGLGQPLSAELLRWAYNRGARRAYLQVVIDNPPALKTYAKLGFKGVYRYWYRRLIVDC